MVFRAQHTLPGSPLASGQAARPDSVEDAPDCRVVWEQLVAHLAVTLWLDQIIDGPQWSSTGQTDSSCFDSSAAALRSFVASSPAVGPSSNAWLGQGSSSSIGTGGQGTSNFIAIATDSDTGNSKNG